MKTIQVIQSAADTSPEDFYERFIRTRTPVILNWMDYVNPALADPKVLKTRPANVQVEVPDAAGNFGSARERLVLSMNEFISRLQSASGPKLYKTTQYDKTEEYVQPPLLASDFENPDILGNLIPQVFLFDFC